MPAIEASLESFTLNEHADEQENFAAALLSLDVLPAQPKSDRGDWDALASISQGALKEVANPIELAKHLAVGTLYAAVGTAAIAMLPKPITVAGAALLTGLGINQVCNAFPEWQHDWKVVSHAGEHTNTEVDQSKKDLQDLGSGAAGLVLEGVGGAATLSVARRVVSEQLLSATFNKNPIHFVDGNREGTYFYKQHIQVQGSGDKMKVTLPDGSYAWQKKSKWTEYFGPTSDHRHVPKSYRVDYRFPEDGSVVRATPSEVRTYHPDGTVTAKLRNGLVTTVGKVSDRSLAEADRGMLNTMEGFRNLVASRGRVLLANDLKEIYPNEALWLGRYDSDGTMTVAVNWNLASAYQRESARKQFGNFVGVLRHEMGHALKASHGEDAFSPEYVAALAKDVANLSPKQKQLHGYFIQSDGPGRPPRFALHETSAQGLSFVTDSTFGTGHIRRWLPDKQIDRLATAFFLKSPERRVAEFEKDFPNVITDLKKSLHYFSS